MVIFLQGKLDAAQRVFTGCQEAVSASGGFLSLPDVWTNLANCHLAQQVRGSRRPGPLQAP